MKSILIFFVICMMAFPRLGTAEVVDVSAAKAVAIAALQSTDTIEQKNETERYRVAGLSKLPAILTLTLAFDRGVIVPETKMQVSHKAASISGPSAFLEKSEETTAEELIKAAVMISAGDAIYALGENAFGSEQVFIQNIEVTLSELGVNMSLADCLCKDSEFTAQELLAIAQAAAQSETFIKYACTYMDELVHADGRRTELVNANRMIRNYSGCFGLMTGSSRDDGYSGVFAAKRNDVCFISVVIGCRNSEERFSIATALFDYTFASFSVNTLAQAHVPVKENVPVDGGDVDSVNLVAHETHVVLKKKDEGELNYQWNVDAVLNAPIYKETSVGTLVVSSASGEVLDEITLYPDVDVESHGFMDIYRRLAYNFLGL